MAINWRRVLGLPHIDSAPVEPVRGRVTADACVPAHRVYNRGDAIGGEYRVFEVFEGGMGRVYLVRHHESQLPLVLKTLKEFNSPQVVEAFRREAETWVKVGFHPNIVRAHFVRLLDGLPFIAAEYVGPDSCGRNSLLDYIGSPMSEGAPVRWCVQLCYGMRHACSHGVVAHRDIKPANLLVDPYGNLRVSDFGLARSVPLPSGAVESEVERQRVAGTLPYMAPEQLLTPDHLDNRVDIYATGVVLYQLLTGRLPFTNPAQEGLKRAIVHDEPAPLAGPLWNVCRRCLAKRPADRFVSFDALLDAIEDVARRLGVSIPAECAKATEASEELFAKVLSYGALGQPALKLKYLQEFLDRIPDDNRGWTELGRVRLEAGDTEGAVDATRKSLELYPFNTHAWNNLGVLLSRLNRFEDAIHALRTAVSHDPMNTGAMLNQSRPLCALRRPLEAIQVLEHAALVAPQKATIWANLGAVQLEVGLLAEAQSSSKRALQLHPGLREAKDILALAAERQGSGG